MSAHDYHRALELRSQRFNALVMAAMLSGRDEDVARLRAAFPHLAAELDQRRRSPHGRTPAELAFDALELPARTRGELARAADEERALESEVGS